MQTPPTQFVVATRLMSRSSPPPSRPRRATARYNHFVSLDGQPYVFTTGASADDTAKLAAICFAEQRQKVAPLSHALWIKWEQETCEAVDRYQDEARYVCEWNATTRVATVTSVVRVRDGLIRSGHTTTFKVAEFGVGAVPRFISPLKVRQFFEARVAAAAAKKAADEKKAAEESLAKMMADAAAAAVVASAKSVPVAVVPAAVSATGLTPLPAAAAAPLPPTPTFGDILGEYVQ